MKKRIFEIIQVDNNDNFLCKLFDLTITISIIINIISLFLLTFDSMMPYYNVLHTIELFTIIIFTIEYILRLWTADLLYKEKYPKIKFIFSFFGIIDLLTILPYFLPINLPVGMATFRVLRIIKIFQLFKINKQYDSFNVIVEVLKEKSNQILSAVFLMTVLMLSSSLFMYSLEHEAQPDVFKNAFSGIWWSVSAILTVGYGDICPITPLGKVFAIIISILGVGIVAIPSGIITSGFYEKSQKIKLMDKYLEEHELNFVSTSITNTHPWANKLIKDIILPPDLILCVINRNKEMIIPKGDIQLNINDNIIIGAKNSKTNFHLHIKEIIIKKDNPWINKKIKDIDISRQTLILSIKRKNQFIIPKGNTSIKQNDTIILINKDNLSKIDV